LSSRRPRKLAWRTLPSWVNSLKAISATSSGLSQVTPRLSGRGTSAGLLSVASGFIRLASSPSVSLLKPVPTLPLYTSLPPSCCASSNEENGRPWALDFFQPMTTNSWRRMHLTLTQLRVRADW
jgi:hypothetical protein